MEEKSDYWDIAARKLRFALSWEAQWEEKLRSAREVRGSTPKAKGDRDVA